MTSDVALGRTDPATRGGELAVQGLRREFGGTVAVDDLTFAVRPGEIVGLVGPNGAGKSTALSVIAGVLPASKGRVVFNGRQITGHPPYKLARTGLVRIPQISQEFGRLTVLENLCVAGPRQRGERFRSAWTPRRSWADQEASVLQEAFELLDRFNLIAKANDYAETLSGGQKRLLELARALMVKPSLLLLDEPMAGVNPAFMETVEACLQEVRRAGVSLLIVEHRLDSVERLCDRVIVMAQGRVLAEGSMQELREMPPVVEAYLVG